jgi:hypothetical protein
MPWLLQPVHAAGGCSACSGRARRYAVVEADASLLMPPTSDTIGAPFAAITEGGTNLLMPWSPTSLLRTFAPV